MYIQLATSSQHSTPLTYIWPKSTRADIHGHMVLAFIKLFKAFSAVQVELVSLKDGVGSQRKVLSAMSGIRG